MRFTNKGRNLHWREKKRKCWKRNDIYLFDQKCIKYFKIF